MLKGLLPNKWFNGTLINSKKSLSFALDENLQEIKENPCVVKIKTMMEAFMRGGGQIMLGK